MGIDQLPVEMLMKIFGFMPTYHQVSLVNKRFYTVACEINPQIICLRLNRWLDSQLLESMRTRNRQISNVTMKGGNNRYAMEFQRRKITSFLDMFSQTITFLELVNITTDESTLQKILSLTPNVERLCIDRIHFSTHDRLSETQRHNDFLALNKLRSLIIIECNNEIITVFSRLPPGCLTELQINCQCTTLAAVLKRQFNIKKLLFGCNWIPEFDVMPLDILDHLQLESLHLRLSNFNSVQVATILSKQTKLKHLILDGKTIVDERVINAVTDLLQLETLEISVVDKTTSSIRKLQNLKKSAPHSTHVSLHINTHKLNEMLQDFNFVEFLEFRINGIPTFNSDDCFNLKLRELCIIDIFGSYKLWVTRLAAAYPNVRKLRVRSTDQGRPIKVGLLLDEFTKLESLIFVVVPHKLTVENLFDKKNLKFLALRSVQQKFTLADKIVKKLSANFDVVHIDQYGDVNMAVDRYTMNCESKEYHYVRI